MSRYSRMSMEELEREFARKQRILQEKEAVQAHLDHVLALSEQLVQALTVSSNSHSSGESTEFTPSGAADATYTIGRSGHQGTRQPSPATGTGVSSSPRNVVGSRTTGGNTTDCSYSVDFSDSGSTLAQLRYRRNSQGELSLVSAQGDLRTDSSGSS